MAQGPGARSDAVEIENDPRAIVARSPMARAQIVAVGVAVLLNALDGFDVLSMSFAAPGIAREWGLDRAALGTVLSMEIIGMAIGSVTIGQLCDRLGRRPTVMACLVLMMSGMALTATADGVAILSLWRFITGLGIGGMLAGTNAVVAEHANARRRNLAIAIMAGGYPAGAVLGGIVASALLVDHGWRWVFGFGAAASAVGLPLVWLLLPETVAWLAQGHSANALRRLNATLARFGHGAVETLPPAIAPITRPSLIRLFAPGLAPTTILMTLAYLAHIVTFYFVLKWAPKIVTDMGYAASTAGGVLVWANLGGLCGAALISLLTLRLDIRRLTIAGMFLSTVCVIAFGRAGSDLHALSILAACTGLCTNLGVVGLYALLARAFPTEMRASGTGFAIGVGRGGAALSPIITGHLFAAGLSLPTVALLLSGGSTIAALALIMMRIEKRA